MDTILITGCSGYIGRHLVSRVKRCGYRVVGVDRKPWDSEGLDDFWQGDLLDKDIVQKSIESADGVIHLAAAKDDWGLSDEEYFRDNVLVTDQLVNCGLEKGVKNWIFYSSVSSMGSANIALDEKAKFVPTTAYGKSKGEAEKIFFELSKKDVDVSTLIIRPSVVFGPGNPKNTNVYRLIDAIYRNRFIMIGKGGTIKTTSYIENLIAATLFLMDRMQKGIQTFIYVDDPKMSTAEMVSQIYSLLKKKQPKWQLPLGLAAPLAYIADVTAAATKIDFPITSARIKKFCTSTDYDASAIRQFGFRQPVAVREALLRTVQWYLGMERSHHWK